MRYNKSVQMHNSYKDSKMKQQQRMKDAIRDAHIDLLVATDEAEMEDFYAGPGKKFSAEEKDILEDLIKKAKRSLLEISIFLSTTA